VLALTLRPSLWVAGALLLAVAALLIAAPAAFAQPRVSESDPQPDANLAEAPAVIHLCFSEPVSLDNTKFDFAVKTPKGLRLGTRTEFQRSGNCADIFVGNALGSLRGIRSFDWTVTSLATGETGSGGFKFSVGLAAAPTPGATATVTPGAEDGGDGGADIVPMAYITAGVAVGGAAFVFLLYLVRRRIGFWLHAPPGEGDGEGGSQH
jgi:methionine-rich copper-binding protein CopC